MHEPSSLTPNNSASSIVTERPSWRGHLAIARIDHWFKNVFMIPGILMAVIVEPTSMTWDFVPRIALGILAFSIMASSNYVINELIDAPFDKLHPEKKNRPIPCGSVHIKLAYVQWIGLAILALLLAIPLSVEFVSITILLWVMGGIYNLRPIRSKDLPYLDVMSEAINNPLRFLAGWYIVDPVDFPPASLLISYWMVGCYFMALKRFAEYRAINDPERASAYRRSFRHYDANKLLISVMFYASAAMLTFGAFLVRYRLELLLAFPFIAFVMSSYLALALRPNSPVQRPEELYRYPALMVAIVVCCVALIVLLLVELPILHDWLRPLGRVGW